MLPSYFVIIGTVINAAGSVGYIRDIIRGKAKPNRVSFFIWGLAPLIAFVAQITQGVGMESLLTFSSTAIPFAIFAASFVNKKSQWKLTPFDFFCGILSLIGLALWLMTRVGNLAILFAILADGFAAIPTIVKDFRHPESEVAYPWLLTVISAALTLLTIESFTFANSAFIVYVLCINGLIYCLTQFRIGPTLKAMI